MREGEPGGARSIPDYVQGAIDYAFARHADVVREQARIDGAPFIAAAPIYMERKFRTRPDHEGKPVKGDRLFSYGTTEFIRAPLRFKFLQSVVKTKKFYKANIRSVVDLKKYFENAISIEDGQRKRQRSMRQREDAIEEAMQIFIAREEQNHNRIVDETIPFKFFTRDVATGPGMSPALTAALIEDYLQEKHSPASVGTGTHFANEYLLQLYPANYVETKRTRAPRRKK